MKIWAVSLLTTELSPHSLTFATIALGIRSLVKLPEKNPKEIHPVLYLRKPINRELAPKLFRGEPAITKLV